MNQGFRLRGKEVSRIEAFSDAVFAFSITLLVVSLEVPKTFNALLVDMSGFAGFAISFFMLVQVWYAHYTYFRRYGLQDFNTIVLNMILLFVILFYVYPLKFLFTLVFSQLSGAGSIPTVTLSNGTVQPMITGGQTDMLFVIYGIGFALVFSIFALLYLEAYRKRKELDLTAHEAFETRMSVWDNLGVAAIGLLSVLVAWTHIGSDISLAGWLYFLIGVEKTAMGMVTGRRRRALARTEEQASAGT